MDFGVLGLEGLVGPESITDTPSLVSLPETKPKILGSVLTKQERSSSSASAQDDYWRTSKIQKFDDLSATKTMPLHHPTPLLRSNSMLSNDSRQQEHMLSFSSPKPEATPFFVRDAVLVERNTQNQTALSFPYYQHGPLSASRSAGYGTGNLNASMHGAFTGVRGPFTPSQWMELEHQALIYKYITARVPVPSNLIIPLKKSLNLYGLPGSSAGSFPPSSLGWGTFHLGYPGNNTDQEPGRCRRTDGKKWRCSRDAVADQKYCERHINRGRHRSRKPVEGQTGHAATGTASSKVVSMSNSISTSVTTSGAASNSIVITQQQLKKMLPGAASRSSAVARVNGAQDAQRVSMMSSTINRKSDEPTFCIPKHDILIEQCSQTEFGLVSYDSLLNPSQKSSYISSKPYESFLNFSDEESHDQHPLRQFIDDWPKDQSNRSVISWPEELKPDCTLLSMSIPMASSDFSSPASSPMREKLALSPLSLSRETHPMQTGLRVSDDHNESSQKQANWIPISWGTSIGGPLGEVLTTSTSHVDSCKSSPALNLLREGWDGSPQVGSSPTGVLQKSTFRSLSNSSSGSSPRAGSKKNNESAGLYEDVAGSIIVS
ncbi:GROWTH-REGULATING FACTOR 2 [Salix purpurea]|uniref:Growth-regulating factor n=1 Tax=Salix purpurea TaxID=77065 RepID=A0A9Q0ZMK3_SALPP|nr:GROWTH-REGULATING FACTOR 2 [Salix purpurea]